MKLFPALILFISATAMANEANFTYFSYEGNDPRFDREIDAANEYLNPIVAGYYPDPSVCRKGDKYYLVNSTFSFFPGVPLFESDDLVNWTQIGHVLDRPSQLDLEGLEVSDGIFAPAISYNKHNDTFYMITTLVGKQGNFFVKSKDPARGWSDPIWLPAVDGIDPSFLFDDDGKAYIVHNAPVFGEPKYDGNRAIRLLRFDPDADTTVGDPVEIVRDGTHVQQNPIWIEGPHLLHVGDWYYLMCAEGGTDENHSEVIFRAPAPEGPWEEAPCNPILTQRTGLAADRPDIVTSTGHADLIEAADGSWWAVFLGCRPYEERLYNTGRETFLLPVEWHDGWPVILAPNTPVPTVAAKPGLSAKPHDALTGNFAYTDRFDGDRLDMKWIFLRNPREGFYSLSPAGLTLRPDGDITRKEPTSTVFRRQQHTNFTAETELTYRPEAEGDLAGMVLLQNERYNFIFGKTILDGKEVLALKRNAGGDEQLLAAVPMDAPSVKLKVIGRGRLYSFYYQPAGTDKWLPLAEDADASNLSTRMAGGFVGTVIGLTNLAPR